jgi:hypothetical protein
MLSQTPSSSTPGRTVTRYVYPSICVSLPLPPLCRPHSAALPPPTSMLTSVFFADHEPDYQPRTRRRHPSRRLRYPRIRRHRCVILPFPPSDCSSDRVPARLSRRTRVRDLLLQRRPLRGIQAQPTAELVILTLLTFLRLILHFSLLLLLGHVAPPTG